MSAVHVEVLVEEPSMEEALRAILPRLLGDTSFQVHPHGGKKDLLGKLPDKLRGYAAWIPKGYRIVIVLDRDGDDCLELKARLEKMAADAGLLTRSTAPSEAAVRAIPRVAIEELEAWYFGDWKAVRAAYPRVPAGIPAKKPYRNPDAIAGGTWEAFERILIRAGYFASGLRKIEAARTIAPHMDLHGNGSKSFRCFRDAILELA